MKAETVVDLFQFIKAARVQRAGLVANKVYTCICSYEKKPSLFSSEISSLQDQYEFGHQVLADFLDGFDTYANFKDIV